MQSVKSLRLRLSQSTDLENKHYRTTEGYFIRSKHCVLINKNLLHLNKVYHDVSEKFEIKFLTFKKNTIFRQRYVNQLKCRYQTF